jgi:phosphate transport system substrate-binding protein
LGFSHIDKETKMPAILRRCLIAGVFQAASLLAASAGFAESRDQIKVVGSSTVFPFSTTVAEHFGKGGKFKAPVVESTGTGGGFKIFCGGTGVDTPDINDASRPITDGEKHYAPRTASQRSMNSRLATME